MEKELTEVYCGNGKGKTALAIGQSLRVATQGKSVIVIQFLKGRDQRSLDFLQDVDNLDFKIFRFEKRECCYEDLTEEEKEILTDACKIFVIKGQDVHLVEGEVFNIKITYPYDLRVAETLIKGEEK